MHAVCGVKRLDIRNEPNMQMYILYMSDASQSECVNAVATVGILAFIIDEVGFYTAARYNFYKQA